MKTGLKPYLELIRIRNWLGYFLMATLGFFVSKGFLFPRKDIIIFYAIISLLLAFAFSINDCFDVKEDKLDKTKTNPIVSQKLALKKGLAFSLFLVALGLVLSMTFGWKVFLLFLIMSSLAFSYSAPPLRLKGRPILDILSHGLFGGALLFLLPIMIFESQLTLSHYLVAFSLFYFSITLELRNHIEDYETDNQAGVRTTVCYLGKESSEQLLKRLALIYPLTLLPLFLIDYRPGYFFWFLISTLFFLFLFQKKYKRINNYRIMDLYAHLSFIVVSIKIIIESLS